MDWLGKSYARLLASDDAKTFLQEDESHNSKDINRNSENLLIKGDNLEVLKHLSNAYHEKIKMIYIDPPYNTGSDGFVYQDDRKFTAEELSKLAGIDKDKAKRILNFTQSKSNSHSAWLTFMYPRLYIARHLLKDDGVIFVSIDDNEVAQLRLLMDEVFGEGNFVGKWNWFKTYTPPNLSNKIKKNIEYVLVYEKQINNVKYKGIKKISNSDDPMIKPQNSIKVLTFPSNSLNFKQEKDIIQAGVYGTDKYPNKLLNDLFIRNYKNKNEVSFENRFVWTQEKLNFELNNQTKISVSKNMVISYKKSNYDEEVPPSMIDKLVNVETTEDAGKYLDNLFGKKVFDYPKPCSLIQYLVNFNSGQDSLILDFFAGSGTTADAVMRLNAEDGGNRKFILVQLPEPIDPKKNKTAYDFVKDELGVDQPTIFDICKERIIRSAKKIQDESKNKQLELDAKERQPQDFGFKIFQTIPNDEGVWGNYHFELDKLKDQEIFTQAGILRDRDIKDLLLTWKTYDGIPLTKELDKFDLAGYNAYFGIDKLYLMHAGFETVNLRNLLEKIDNDKSFNPTTIIAFGYLFNSKDLREIAENLKSYNNKKNTDIDFVVRY